MGTLENTNTPVNETPTCSKCLSTFAFKMALFDFLEIPKSTPIFIVYLF